MVWVNEEDHTRLISMESSGNMFKVFKRFCEGITHVSISRMLHASCLYLRFFNSRWGVPGGERDQGEWVGVHVERTTWLHLDLPQQPRHWPPRWSPRQNPQFIQGLINICPGSRTDRPRTEGRQTNRPGRKADRQTAPLTKRTWTWGRLYVCTVA